MKFRNRHLLLPAVAVLAAVVVSCGSDGDTKLDPASIIDPGAATAVAAAANTTSLVPILADMDNEPAAFLDAIPEAERACLEEKWGEQRYADIRSGDEQLNDESLEIFQCITGETWSRVIAGGLFNEVGGLDPATLSCVATKLGDGSIAAIADQLQQVDGDPTLEDYLAVSMQMLSEIIPVTFCLNEEERARLDVQGQFGMSVSTLECLYEGTKSLGLDFSAVFQIAPPGFEPPAEYVQVAVDCGLDVSRTETQPGEGTMGTPEVEMELIPIPSR